MAAALVPLQNITLGSTQSTITFANIPTTGYRDLRVIAQAQVTTGTQLYRLRFNGDSGANYSYVIMSGTGSAANSQSASSQTEMRLDGYANLNSNPNIVQFDVQDAFATDKHKTVLSRTNNSALGVDAVAGRWASTAVITSLVLFPSSSTFTAGSTFALYGVVA